MVSGAAEAETTQARVFQQPGQGQAERQTEAPPSQLDGVEDDIKLMVCAMRVEQTLTPKP